MPVLVAVLVNAKELRLFFLLSEKMKTVPKKKRFVNSRTDLSAFCAYLLIPKSLCFDIYQLRPSAHVAQINRHHRWI